MKFQMNLLQNGILPQGQTCYHAWKFLTTNPSSGFGCFFCRSWSRFMVPVFPHFPLHLPLIITWGILLHRWDLPIKFGIPLPHSFIMFLIFSLTPIYSKGIMSSDKKLEEIPHKIFNKISFKSWLLSSNPCWVGIYTYI